MIMEDEFFEEEELFEEAGLFSKLRERVRNGEALRKIVGEYIEPGGAGEGYDLLDLFINRLFSEQEMPVPTRELEPEMVEFYKTPARMVFEWVDPVGFARDDVFFDLGSGLGQVVMLVNLLTGIEAWGVEIEPVYCEYARSCATGLGLREVRFVAADARDVDLGDGTVFFLYTPFRGEILEAVLERLRQVAQSKRIKVISYGPCTEEVAKQDWLRLFQVLSDGALGVAHLFHATA
jgi:hypothetical protein